MPGVRVFGFTSGREGLGDPTRMEREEGPELGFSGLEGGCQVTALRESNPRGGWGRLLSTLPDSREKWQRV